MDQKSETKLLNIYQRINSVMKSVSYVKKDAVVQTYKAVSHDQVVAAARPEFVKAGIIIYPEQLDIGSITRAEGSKMHLFSAFYRINFVNMDCPEDRIQITIEAHAQDNGDKSPGKAVTYATKAAILKVLSLETGENDESRMPLPTEPIKRKLTNERLEKAILAIKAGEFTLEQMSAFDLTEDQIVRLNTEIGAE